MAKPTIIDNISELGSVLKVRHPGRSDPYSMKKQKGLAQQYQLHGKRALHRTAKRAKRPRR